MSVQRRFRRQYYRWLREQHAKGAHLRWTENMRFALKELKEMGLIK